jgi:hypothetical protein
MIAKYRAVKPQYHPQHLFRICFDDCRIPTALSAVGTADALEMSLGIPNTCGVAIRRKANVNGYAISAQIITYMRKVA